MIFFDTETCGLHGPIVLVQWARNDGEINLHSVWTTPINQTLELYEMFTRETVVGFNLAFDWFHVCQQYTTLKLLAEEEGYDIYPEDYIDEYAVLEDPARDGPCLKPESAFDIMLHARKTEYQSTMDRGDIRIKRVPTQLAQQLVFELDKRIELNDVYFARYKDPKKRWTIVDVKDDFDDIVPEFKDVVLKFAPSSALKALAVDALGEDVTKFQEISTDKAFTPLEAGYAPFATAPKYIKQKSGLKRVVRPSPDKWWWTWPQVIHHHIEHWGYNRLAREYAWDDVDYTRRLYYHFGEPEAGDTDSLLACMVGAVRWRGYKINCAAIRELKEKREELLKKAVINFNSPAACKKYLTEVLDEVERLAMTVNGKFTTKGVVLEELVKWRKNDVCNDCSGMGCDNCDEGLVHTEEPHPVAARAREMLDARHAKKEIENYEKLLQAGRFHASFKVIGTLSSRMSGADGMNPQGIKRASEVRRCFPLAWDDQQLDGGDFEGFEVTLMDAAYGDPKLRKDLLTGYKIHGIFGTYLFPGMTYDDILATKGLPDEQDRYTRSKNGVFALAYGGEAYTLQNRVGIDEATAEDAYQRFTSDYTQVGEARKRISNMFCSMRQPNGIGTRVEWHEPHDYIESMFKFRRYFTLENMICKELFKLAENPPEHWHDLKMKVVRRDREQTATGAVRSALFAAAFALQSANMRAALNHVIQSSGATLTKDLQADVWQLQPSGICEWMIQPLNIHDEIMTPVKPELSSQLHGIVDEFVEKHRETIPLLAIDWSSNLETWADK